MNTKFWMDNWEERNPTLGAFTRLAALLLFYAALFVLGLWYLFLVLPPCGNLIDKIAIPLGGGMFIKCVGFIVAFGVFMTVQIATGVTLGLIGVWFSSRWPNGLVMNFIRWVKTQGVNSSDDGI